MFIVDDHPAELAVTVMLCDPGVVRPDLDPSTVAEAERRYYSRVTRQRLHQAAFRSRVLRAYGQRCTICRLRHSVLLDAAHIRPDHQGGRPPRHLSRAGRRGGNLVEGRGQPVFRSLSYRNGG